MPPKFKFQREEILSAALDIVRESGFSAVTARALAARLHCSVKPIFGLYKNMEELKGEVLLAAEEIYQSYLKEGMESGLYPPYKASGMAYIRFAKEEKELFKLLFMRDRSQEAADDGKESLRPILDLVKANLGLSEESAYLLHLEMWIVVHGAATMSATSYLDWDEEFISGVLTDTYLGLSRRHLEKESENERKKEEEHGSH